MPRAWTAVSTTRTAAGKAADSGRQLVTARLGSRKVAKVQSRWPCRFRYGPTRSPTKARTLFNGYPVLVLTERDPFRKPNILFSGLCPDEKDFFSTGVRIGTRGNRDMLPIVTLDPSDTLPADGYSGTLAGR